MLGPQSVKYKDVTTVPREAKSASQNVPPTHFLIGDAWNIIIFFLSFILKHYMLYLICSQYYLTCYL